MPTYAQIDPAGRCIGKSALRDPETDPRLVPIASMDEDVLGRTWDGNAWQADAPPVAYGMVVTSVIADNPAAIITGTSGIICPVGTQIQVDVEIRDGSDQVVPITTTIAVPVRARDGREEMMQADFTNGVATITTVVDQSAWWRITEDDINHAVGGDPHFTFAGYNIRVVRH